MFWCNLSCRPCRPSLRELGRPPRLPRGRRTSSQAFASCVDIIRPLSVPCCLQTSALTSTA
jgi:hypothetical protein